VTGNDHPDNDDKKVIDLFAGADEPPITVTGARYKRCVHRRMTLDTEQRLAICKSCGARVEVFDWLVEHAGEPWKRIWNEMEARKKEVERLRRERGKLKDDLRKLRARVRYWRNQLPPEEHVAGVASDSGAEQPPDAEDA
jgi:hypothetical protein